MEERIDSLNALLIEARRDIRALQAALVDKPRLGAREEDVAQDDAPAKKPRREDRPGDMYRTDGDICVYLEPNTFGWLYNYDDLPAGCRHRASKTDLIISDHDYANIDTNHPEVTRLTDRERAAAVANIRKDTVFLADSKVLKTISPDTVSPDTCSRESIDILDAQWDCQIHFGHGITNRDDSHALIDTICAAAGDTAQPTSPTALNNPKKGRCDACNLSPRWVTQSIVLAGQTYAAGETCMSRIAILLDYVTTRPQHEWYVGVFKLLDTVHMLSDLKSSPSE